MSSPSLLSTSTTFSAEYLAEDFSYWPRVGIYLALSITVFLMLLRVYVRVVLIKWLGFDDLLMVFAVICNTIVTILSIRAIDYGAGKHMGAIPPKDLAIMFKCMFAGQLLSMVTLWLCRISGLAFYARIGKNVVQLRKILIFSCVVVSLTLVVQLMLISFECIPIDTLWDPRVKGKCLGNPALFSATAGTIICDILVLLIPIFIIIKVKATIKRKLLLAVVMCFGVFSIVATIFRILVTIPAIRPTTTDPTKYFALLLVWSSTEITAAVIALCMPSLKRFFSSLLSDSPLSSDSNFPKHFANSDQPGQRMSVLHRKHRVRVASGEATDISDSEENLWVDGTSAPADPHGKTNSSASDLV